MMHKPFTWPGKIIDFAVASLFKRPATVRYPAEPLAMPERFRGMLLYFASQCTGCKLCMRDCPAEAITIRKVGERRYEAVVDRGRCIMCAQCVDVCLKKALAISPEVELAQTERDLLRVVFHEELLGRDDANTSRAATQAQGRPARRGEEAGGT